MKTTLFILLYLFFIHTKAYSIEIEVDREEFSTGESVTAPIPVSPPIYLKVGNSNTLVFPADRNTYTFEIGIDPIAERFIGENFEGVKEWVGEGEMSIPDGFTETDFCWESISYIRLSFPECPSTPSIYSGYGENGTGDTCRASGNCYMV